MKKLLIILFLSLLLPSNLSAYNYKNNFRFFNKWLYDNGHSKYVEKAENEKCKSFDKGDTNWYYNNCDQPQFKNNLNIKAHPNRWGILSKSNPSRDTLIYYFYI